VAEETGAGSGGQVRRTALLRLIAELHASGRVATAQELAELAAYVAAAGFDPHARETVRGRPAGVMWRGQAVRTAERLPPEELKFLWHAIVQGE
jgi:hypothetical protein